MSSGTSQSRPSLRAVDSDGRPDPARRLSRFREEHPDIEIIWRNPWEAVMPEPDGAQRWIVRHELHDLLDEVEHRLAEQAASRSGCVDQT
jgi:hypothetical protein